jgi:hypothetical protein
MKAIKNFNMDNIVRNQRATRRLDVEKLSKDEHHKKLKRKDYECVMGMLKTFYPSISNIPEILWNAKEDKGSEHLQWLLRFFNMECRTTLDGLDVSKYSKIKYIC